MNDMYDNIEDKKSREEYTMLSKYRIKELRNNANISQDKLSEIIGVSRTQIIRWEKITKDNDAVIDSLYKNRMCRYFRVPLRKLYNCEYQEIVDIAKKDAIHIMKNVPKENRCDLTNVINSLSELMTQASNTECTKDTLDSIEDKFLFSLTSCRNANFRKKHYHQKLQRKSKHSFRVFKKEKVL